MQPTQRVHPATALAILVVCPLLSAATLAGIAVGFAALFGAPHDIVIGAVVAAAVFVVNSIALCLALARGDDDRPAVLVSVAEPGVERAEYAQAS